MRGQRIKMGLLKFPTQLNLMQMQKLKINRKKRTYSWRNNKKLLQNKILRKLKLKTRLILHKIKKTEMVSLLRTRLMLTLKMMKLMQKLNKIQYKIKKKVVTSLKKKVSLKLNNSQIQNRIQKILNLRISRLMMIRMKIISIKKKILSKIIKMKIILINKKIWFKKMKKKLMKMRIKILINIWQN